MSSCYTKWSTVPNCMNTTDKSVNITGMCPNPLSIHSVHPRQCIMDILSPIGTYCRHQLSSLQWCIVGFSWISSFLLSDDGALYVQMITETDGYYSPLSCCREQGEFLQSISTPLNFLTSPQAQISLRFLIRDALYYFQLNQPGNKYDLYVRLWLLSVEQFF